jgi:hypothetical protein
MEVAISSTGYVRLSSAILLGQHNEVVGKVYSRVNLVVINI